MQKRWMLFAAALMMPLIGMAYLYSRNAEYLSAVQVLIVSAFMAAVSALGYGLIRLVFRSSASAMLGCLAAWVMFFAFGAGLSDFMERFWRNTYTLLGVYAAATILLTLIAALIARRYRGDALGMISLTMACVMLLLNGYPAVRAAINMEKRDGDASAYKTEFTVDPALPSPNVYWIHTDGMLGVGAMEKYFGEDQREFLDALQERGFMVNPDANFEAAHMTWLAVPSLFCPTFYDERIAPRITTHEDAMALRADKPFVRNETLTARVQNETRLAFARKGYSSQTLSMFGTYYPPVTDRFYMTDDPRGAYRLTLRDPESLFESIVCLRELCMLLKLPNSQFFKALLQLSDVLDLGVKSQRLEYTLTPERRLALMEGSRAALNDAPVFDALNDALHTQQPPTLTMVFFLVPHNPYAYRADGERVASDPMDIANYAGNHLYASKLLVNMVDMILERDPDAVIVLQSDHGPHTSARDAQTLAANYGEGALLDIWNQVMSAVRVPEPYKTYDAARMLESPLNISRYLMNRFVGERYAYVDARNQ